MDTLYTVRFREVSGLSSFKFFFKIRPLVAEILHILRWGILFWATLYIYIIHVNKLLSCGFIFVDTQVKVYCKQRVNIQTKDLIYLFSTISVRPIISIFDALIFAKFSGLVEIWLLLSAKLNLKNFQSPKWANRGDKMERESRRCNTQHTQYRIYYSNSRKRHVYKAVHCLQQRRICDAFVSRTLESQHCSLFVVWRVFITMQTLGFYIVTVHHSYLIDYILLPSVIQLMHKMTENNLSEYFIPFELLTSRINAFATMTESSRAGSPNLVWMSSRNVCLQQLEWLQPESSSLPENLLWYCPTISF